MLGFGGDDEKEKLKQNMEEIKNLIDRGGQEESRGMGDLNPPETDNTVDDALDSGPEGLDEDIGEEDPFGDEQFTAEGEEPGGELAGTPPDTQETGAETRTPGEPTDVTGRETPRQEERSQPRQDRENRELDTREPDRADSGIERDIPEPAETRELDVPEIEKGPLFIRRKKFRRALEMIDEMFYIRDEIEDTVNRLESGIQRDRETEKDLRELMQGFESNRSEVEKIVSPGEE